MPRLSQGRVGSLSEGSESSLSHVVYLYGRRARLYSYSCEYYSYHVNIDMQFPHEYEYANTSVFIFKDRPALPVRLKTLSEVEIGAGGR